MMPMRTEDIGIGHPTPFPHLDSDPPAPSAGPIKSCDWQSAGLWASSPGWAGPRRLACTCGRRPRPPRSRRRRRRSVRRTHRAARCSPPAPARPAAHGPTAGPCRTAGSPSARTSASDRTSSAPPVMQQQQHFQNKSLASWLSVCWTLFLFFFIM